MKLPRILILLQLNFQVGGFRKRMIGRDFYPPNQSRWQAENQPHENTSIRRISFVELLVFAERFDTTNAVILLCE